MHTHRHIHTYFYLHVSTYTCIDICIYTLIFIIYIIYVCIYTLLRIIYMMYKLYMCSWSEYHTSLRQLTYDEFYSEFMCIFNFHMFMCIFICI